MTLRERAVGAWALVHPGPSLMTVAAYVLCAVLAAGGHPAPGKLVVSALGMVCMQFAISALNDYCDRAADARNPTKRKPLVLGQISPRFALWSSIILAAAMISLFIPFGSVSLALALTFLALGFAYDLGVKATPFSGLMLGFAFPTIPLLAWNIFARLTPAIFTALPLGLALGIGIHLADALPDAEADTAVGVRGLTQVLGKYALGVCIGAFYAATLLCQILLLIRQQEGRFVIAQATIFLSVALLFLPAIIYRSSRLTDSRRNKLFFLILMADALLIVLAWILIVTAQ